MFKTRKKHTKGVKKGDIEGDRSSKDKDKDGNNRIGETRGAYAF